MVVPCREHGTEGEIPDLSDLKPGLAERLIRSGQVDGPIRTFAATPLIGELAHAAYLDAEAWLVMRHGG